MSGVGHNAPAGAALRSLVERIERLDKEKAEVAEAIKEVYAEAKGNGFDVKPIRALIRLRKRDRAKVAEEKSVLELYAEALGCADLI
jgi:uncharacterized protein (UPF0335 family)